MNRPLFNDSIVKLEASFEERKADNAFLKILVEELSFRSTDRAKRLNALVIERLQPSKPNDQTEQSQSIPPPASSLPVLSLADYQNQNIKPDMNIPLTNNARDILSSWIALEVLSPQTFRKPEDLAGAYGSIVKLEKALLPWEGEGEKSKPNYRLYYQVVLETINFEKAVSALLNIYADKRVDPPVVKGEAVLAVVVLDNKGRLVESPAAAISSFAWGVPQALKGDLRKLADWSEAEKKLIEDVDNILRRTDEEGKELPVDRRTLETARNYFITSLGMSSAFLGNHSFAIRTYEYYTSPEAPDPVLLNSFFVGDLIKAGGLFKEGKAPQKLQRYIGLKKPAERKDLLNDKDAFEKALSPSLMSPARWPGAGRHPLVVLQQAAVDLALSELKTEGILAVNGPPGTGKTTLLRDIVAGVVSSRAEAMF